MADLTRTDVINSALLKAVDRYEKKNGTINPIPKK